MAKSSYYTAVTHPSKKANSNANLNAQSLASTGVGAATHMGKIEKSGGGNMNMRHINPGLKFGGK